MGYLSKLLFITYPSFDSSWWLAGQGASGLSQPKELLVPS